MKFKFKFKTLQVNLFTSYSSFFIITLLIIGFTFYSFFTNYATEKVSEQQGQLCTSISNSLDAEIKKMDTVSMNIIYSNLIKDHFQKYLSLNSTDTSNILVYSERYSNIRSLIDVVMAILGPFQTVSQANIYDLNGNMIGTGLFNGEITVDMTKMPWYDKTIKMDGFKAISEPSNIQLFDKANLFLKNDKFVSVSRIYSDSNYNKQGIVEVAQDCKVLFKYINDIKSNNLNQQIYVVNSDGHFVYPYESNSNESSNYYESLIKNDVLSPLKIHKVKNQNDGSKEVMTYAVSSYTGWSIIVVQSEKSMFSWLKNFTNTFILFSVLALLMILVLSYIISRKVTIPLRKLRHALKNMNIDELFSRNSNEAYMDKNTLNEIEMLNNTFNSMYQKMGKSLNELLIAKSEEMNAKILAMQSQMNPHFLHNNLANLSAMAEEGMNEEIVSMCNDISYMLRYISTESKIGVELRSEIDYTEKYLNCMKIRYEEDLKFDINISEEMLDIIIPKLIIQPLVENSIKYGLSTAAPWNISIKGYIEDRKWYISVSDSGLGFQPLLINKFQEMMTSPSDLSDLPELHMGGMGLQNICLRLKLMYKNQAVFKVQNQKNGGAIVVVGGYIYQD